MKQLQIVILFLCLTAGLNAQVMRQQTETKINSVGDAELTVSMKLTPEQWQNWLQTIGNDPIALEEAMTGAVPDQFVDNFQFERNDEERSWKASFKAYGMCKVDENGKWHLETSLPNLDVTEVSERKFLYATSPPEMGGNLIQTNTVIFPEEASGITTMNDASGQTVFTFDMDIPSGGGGFNILKSFGFVILGIGVLWLLKTLFIDD